MPSLATASARIFDLSLGEMLWSRRTVFLGLLVGGPIVIGLVLRIVDAMSGPAVRVDGVRLGGADIYGVMLWYLVVRFIVPVLCLLYGQSVIADEVDVQSITYLFTRRSPR